jgi:hypothetical protein
MMENTLVVSFMFTLNQNRMKANELRIGNYVYDTLGKVNKIDLEAITYIVKEPHNQVKPIPITEEWLLKFDMELTDGFSSSRKLYLNNYENDISKITYSPKEGLLRLSNGHTKGTMLIPHIKYVNQLQNIYFALTGKELTFKSE